MTHRSASLSRRTTLAAFLTAGCVQLPGQGPGPREFRLTAKSTFPADLPKVRWGLAVAEPDAQRTVDTDRVAIIRDGVAVEYVADVRWIDRAPTMLQALIVQSFVNSGGIATVGTDRDQLEANFLLRTILRAFQVQGSPGSPGSSVRVSLDAALVTLPARVSAATTSIATSSPVTAASVDSVVNAFEDATGQALKQLVVWTLQAGQTAPPVG